MKHLNGKSLNCDLARALGVDPQNVAKIVLTIEPGELPTLEVRRYILTADGLQTAVEMLNLVQAPKEEGP